MTEQQTKIDPEKFAYHFMNTINLPKINTENMEAAAKEALAAYLSAYYLIQRFNHLENDFFIEEQTKFVSNYQRILSELNKY
ncbi:hypothetical protein CN445_29930 [Bacillus cereus]|uniref:DUF3144 domain-containing protein n=1 Tax=Bacillus cereus BAG5X1-1 TaxID=1053189 RepID=J7ZMK0_BACCE|nr:hypothetical protein [Bacillus cereus]EJQ04578.1 hypothetical protein IE3_05323 [Bacillus cereus BAG3X2-1]EJQ37591.1 hypothetical protein IEE_05150 [Bacillus cereus BAG5X1-1]PEW80992.1 hypothetical protein CN445_29930 [Bacillus cereus]PEZ84318.1 hypothetical protein CN374_27870 [Bacillus cereus]PFN67555.1 hypothetical protein COJ62_23125 [Bacillus cereus]